MAPHSSTLAWKIPWMEEPGGLQSMGSWRVGHDWATSLALFHFHALEKKMAPHSRVLAWRIPGTGEPGGLSSMGSHRVVHGWGNLAAATACWFFRSIDLSPGSHCFAVTKMSSTHNSHNFTTPTAVNQCITDYWNIWYPPIECNLVTFAPWVYCYLSKISAYFIDDIMTWAGHQ